MVSILVAFTLTGSRKILFTSFSSVVSARTVLGIKIEIMNMYNKLSLSNNIPETLEQAYYRYLYNKQYQGTDHLIEYYWMPKYVNAKDSSARTLSVYNEKNTNNSKNISQ